MRVYFTATVILSLSQEDAGILSSIVRVHSSRIDAQKADPHKLVRRAPVLLRNPENGLATVRFVLGSRPDAIRSPTAIAVDYDTKDALGIRDDRMVQIEVCKASRWRVLRFFMTHPDMAYRLSTQLGVLGAVLGIAGVLLGLASFVI